MKLIFAFVVLITISLVLGEKTQKASGLNYNTVVDYLKKSFVGKDMKAEILRHWQMMDLVDSRGQLKSNFPELKPYFNQMMAEESVSAFIDRALICWKANPIFDSVLANLNTSEGYKGKEEDRKNFVFSAVCYAMVLDRLTKITRDDYRVLDATLREWPVIRKDPGFKEETTTFGKAKYLTVQYCMNTFLEGFKSGKISSINGKATIPLNIMEAVMRDYRLGFPENAYAGRVLTYNNPGHIKTNEKTGEGPTTLSNGDKTKYGRAVQFHYPFQQDWDDLYSTWNLAFVMNYETWPYFFSKLLNPAVACYQPQPDEYLYNRAVSLWAHLNWEDRRRINKNNTIPKVDWVIPKAVKSWGVTNKAASDKYSAKVSAADPSFLDKVKGAASKLNSYMPWNWGKFRLLRLR